MSGIDANTFMTKIKKTFKNDNDYEAWLVENIYFKPVKILIKAKHETFKGESRHRFYAVDVSRIKISDNDEGNSQSKVGIIKGKESSSFSFENQLLLDKLSQGANSTQ